MPKGDCFAAAFEELLARRGTWLVHGLPVNQQSRYAGRRYWHAWVETETDREPMVRDTSNDRIVTLPRSVYYRLGRLTEDHVFRYSLVDAVVLANEHRHFGPWVEGWEEMSYL